MMQVALIQSLFAISACDPAPRPIDPAIGQPMSSKLDFAYCEKIGRETFDSGGVSYNLCPGYMPDGQDVELY